MKKLTFDDYWDQGWNARVRGKSINDNPYPNGGWSTNRDAWTNWNSGYWACQHEEETGHICLPKKVDEDIYTESTCFFEKVFMTAKMTKLKETREDIINDFGGLCAKRLGIKKAIHYVLRNKNTTLASYNEKDNAIYYHSDLLWLPVDLVKSIIAHEVAHVAAGYENGHNSIWLDYYNKIKEAFPEENINIFKTADEIADNDENFKGLVPGKIMNAFYNEYPKIIGHVKVGIKTGFGLVDIDEANNTLLVVRPTFYCSDTFDIDGNIIISEDEIKDAEYAAEEILINLRK